MHMLCPFPPSDHSARPADFEPRAVICWNHHDHVGAVDASGEMKRLEGTGGVGEGRAPLKAIYYLY